MPMGFAFNAMLFQSTPPRREVTMLPSYTASAYAFQSTPPRREVTASRQVEATRRRISIHTSPKGGDKKH